MTRRLRIHIRERVVRTHLAVEEIAERIAGADEWMLSDAVPVAGDRVKLLAIGTLLRFTATGGRARCVTGSGVAIPLPLASDPLGRLWALMNRITFEGPALAAPLRSLHGFLAYDAARGFERLPSRHDRVIADYRFFMPQYMFVAGSDSSSVQVIGFGYTAEEAEAQLTAATVAMAREPDRPMAPDARWPLVQRSLRRSAFTEAVRRAKEHILDGDVFQLVLSLRWSVPSRTPPLPLYRKLTAINPSPYQFCYKGPGFSAVGASPEPLITLAGGQAAIRPLAGTRRRGANQAEDIGLEQDLRNSVKELAEHRMLVDLARNDLSRACRPGSVRVDELMGVERYSHVMHLVSNVVGEPRDGSRADQLLRAGFPAGTMTGTPKVRAMEIIDELEPVARGLYSGGVGLFSPEELHLYLTIRSLVLQNGLLHLQAGAGIVHDSDPDEEYAECINKLTAASEAAGIAR